MMPDSRGHSDRPITISVNGQPMSAPAGTILASALWNGGVRAFRRSVQGEGRGPVCGMGVCFECRATVDGTPHLRTCQIFVRDGLEVVTGDVPVPQGFSRPISNPTCELRSCDVLVVGAGPAGLAAANAARSHGVSVLVADDNPGPGGQIWRRSRGVSHPLAARLENQARSAGVAFLPGVTVLDAHPNRTEFLDWNDQRLVVEHRALILATGARELLVPFPGWTLPGVFGAGGLQALVKGGLEVRGQRILVAGSGPLLLPVAATLKAAGAQVVALVERVSRRTQWRFGASLLASPKKLRQGAHLLKTLVGVPRRFGDYPVRAEGPGVVQQVTLKSGISFTVDALALGDGLVPQTELPRRIGCRSGPLGVEVGDGQETSVPGVFAAGEVTGMGGLDLALLEGTVAGHAAAGRPTAAHPYRAALRREQAFARRLRAAFPLPQVDMSPDTVICRCEDTLWSQVVSAHSVRDAKLSARCGMGPCQGRTCGTLVHLALGAAPDRVRPPCIPVPMHHLLSPEAEADHD